MAVRPYDHARDDLHAIEHVDEVPSFDEQLRDGMGLHASKLAVAVEILLQPFGNIDEEAARRTIARQTLDEYEAWFAELKATVDEQWHARFGGGS